MLLEVSELSVSYGESVVVEDVSFCVDAGQIVCLIGPNGAGKSTVLKAVGGTIVFEGGAITNGMVRLDDDEVSGLRPDQLVERRMAFVPDGRRLFQSLSVRENLEMGGVTVRNSSLFEKYLSRVFALFPAIEPRLQQCAGSLSGGEQQMLAIGRALMSNPQVLLIDEPSLGLAPRLLDSVFSKIKQLTQEQNIGVVIVEQNVQEVLKISDKVVALKLGKTVYSGGAMELHSSDQKLKEIFL